MEFNQDLVFRLLSLVLLGYLTFLGGICMYHGFRTLLFFRALRQRGQSTTGRVIGLREEPASYEEISATYPIFSYQVNGQLYEVEAERLHFQDVKVGQEMVLRFLPENPGKCTWRKTGFSGLGWLLLGLATSTIGVLGVLQMVEYFQF